MKYKLIIPPAELPEGRRGDQEEPATIQAVTYYDTLEKAEFAKKVIRSRFARLRGIKIIKIEEEEK